MSKKKKKQQVQAEVKPEIPIQDDPYWKVSSVHMDAHRVGRFISKFERFEYAHPLWAEELLDGTPTFYCVLGVVRGVTKEEVKEAFEKKSRFSSYPGYILDEACEVLSSLKFQREYDELLFVFEQMTKCMPLLEKSDLIQNHDKRLRTEKEFVRMGALMPRYKNYIDFYMKGMPDLYEIAGLAKNSSLEEIKNQCENGSDLFKKIYTMLGDRALREEYDFMMNFILKFGDESKFEERKSRRKRWDGFGRELFEKIVLNALCSSDEDEIFKKRLFEILKTNQDWLQYLPPNKETFFSILGLDGSSLPVNKKEIEKIIREKYRTLEKTPKINLAYTVLKNASQREDYLWLIENNELLNAIQRIFSDEEPEVPSSKRTRTGKLKENARKKKIHDQMTIEEIIEKILEKHANYL